MKHIWRALLVTTSVLALVPSWAAQNPVHPSKIVNWSEILAQPATNSGRSHSVMRSRTATLDELEVHTTTLQPGENSHAPHRHPQEEVLVLREGTLEVLIEGRATRVETGGFVFLASQEEHSAKNVGTAPASYYVMQWKSAPPSEKPATK